MPWTYRLFDIFDINRKSNVHARREIDGYVNIFKTLESVSLYKKTFTIEITSTLFIQQLIHKTPVLLKVLIYNHFLHLENSCCSFVDQIRNLIHLDKSIGILWLVHVTIIGTNTKKFSHYNKPRMPNLNSYKTHTFILHAQYLEKRQILRYWKFGKCCCVFVVVRKFIKLDSV